MSDVNNNRAFKPASESEMAEIIDSFRSIVKSLRDSGRESEQKLGISSAQLFVLQELRHGAASINELATRTYTHQSSVSMVVGRLVDRRLVSRTPAKTDARKVSITLTAAGRNLVRRAPDAAQTRLVDALKMMSTSDLRNLAQQLGNLTRIMERRESDTALREKRSSMTA